MCTQYMSVCVCVCVKVVDCSLIWESASLPPIYIQWTLNTQPYLGRLGCKYILVPTFLHRVTPSELQLHLYVVCLIVSLGPARVVCTSLWPRLRVLRVWASPWTRVAVSSPVFPNWSTTTARTDCLSLERSTWPCSILCPEHTEHDRRKHIGTEIYMGRKVYYTFMHRHTDRHTC